MYMGANEKTSSPIGQIMERIKAEVSAYVDTRLRILQLEAYEKGSFIASVAAFGLLVAFVLVPVVMLMLITLAIVIAQCTGSWLIGFSCVLILSIIVLLVIISKRKSIQNKFTNAVLDAIMKAEQRKDEPVA